MAMQLSVKAMTWSLGLFGAVSFVLCVIYGLLAPPALHAARLLEMILPGFRWLKAGSVVLGLAESFLYGVYAGLVLTPIYNFVARKDSARRAGA